MWLFCGCCAVVVWLLCGCCEVLCGCCVVVVRSLCGCCVVPCRQYIGRPSSPATVYTRHYLYRVLPPPRTLSGEGIGVSIYL